MKNYCCGKSSSSIYQVVTLTLNRMQPAVFKVSFSPSQPYIGVENPRKLQGVPYMVLMIVTYCTLDTWRVLYIGQ